MTMILIDRPVIILQKMTEVVRQQHTPYRSQQSLRRHIRRNTHDDTLQHAVPKQHKDRNRRGPRDVLFHSKSSHYKHTVIITALQN